ncbi:MAG: tRNA (adenosine(37)-N6)-threonylcarbamoyltransferase complex dimerization subunit type 1 TsaB [Chloroflexi bacterium]|nr:tRNA (adenosine(37)-N6)-threonylcarbamoyltransferase complex dimerization subunit type 1 TsaB [Chloroflexota bacterium]MBU1750389.1 tRNA (adenosine(37)-N6)-threonylcarbamoyltransferase complex dimerization subunit type 1 TsaB [Chloroflexota bacterium]
MTHLRSLLALDTATDTASVAVYDATGVRAEYTWHTAGRHSQSLMPHVDRLLAQCDLRPADVGAIAVTLGPGSYNGLRVGVATAKGLALALAIPLIGVPTLNLLAYPLRWTALTVQPLLDARRGEFATARYRTQRQRWARQDDARLATLDEICIGVDRRTLFCGEFAPAVTEELKQRLGSLARFASPSDSLRRAGVLAELAWARWQAHDTDDPDDLEPIYLRRPPITEPGSRP